MIASPGQFTGYLDWIAKTKFTVEGVPDEVVRDWTICGSKVIYDFMTPAERDEIDGAAQTTGLTEAQLWAFSNKVAETLRRFQPGTFDNAIRNSCGAYADAFTQHRRKALKLD